MEYLRPCVWCGEEFYATRIDQQYCCVKHRNAFNNNQYKERLSPYKANMDSDRNQDDILEGIWQDGEEVLIDAKMFKKLNIDPEKARNTTVAADNKILKLVFVKFSLEMVGNDLFKINKL
jgi:hypothetical protein